MLSDVLHDAVKEIDRYLIEVPAYRSDERLFELIKDLQIHMDLVRIELDKPPACKTSHNEKGDYRHF